MKKKHDGTKSPIYVDTENESSIIESVGKINESFPHKYNSRPVK